MDERDSPAAIEQKLGVKVVKIEMMPMARPRASYISCTTIRPI